LGCYEFCHSDGRSILVGCFWLILLPEFYIFSGFIFNRMLMDLCGFFVWVTILVALGVSYFPKIF